MQTLETVLETELETQADYILSLRIVSWRPDIILEGSVIIAAGI